MILELVYAVGSSFPKPLQKKIKNIAAKIGFESGDWVRIVMYRECFAFIESIGPETRDVLESQERLRGGGRVLSLNLIGPLNFPISTFVPKYSIGSST